MTRADLITYNYDKQCVTWFEHYYNRAIVRDLISFLIFWVKNEKFKVIVEGQEFIISIHHDGYGWTAITTEYDGPEDKINCNWSPHGKEDAFEGLIEKLQGAIIEGKLIS